MMRVLLLKIMSRDYAWSSQICLLMSMDDGTSIYQMVIIASYDCEIFFCLDDDLVFLMVGI